MASPRPVNGMTLVELVVILALIFILVSLSFPTQHTGLVKGQLIQAMSNERQIHMAAMSMATDGAANFDASLGWPGDLKANGRIATLSDYVNLLVRNDYLKPGDLKVFSAAGIKAYPNGKLTSGSNGVLSPAFTEENSAFKVFLAKDKDPAETVFLTTKNYRYNSDLSDPNAKPFGDRGFVVLRKGGDASVYKKQQARNIQLLGKLPGDDAVESAANCLNPGAIVP
ncbi:MAG: type II secretion system protein [Chthoniobacteraceae bacterium]|nr:type II secretion system protein [Chthoniobacteraceae bacterium]